MPVTFIIGDIGKMPNDDFIFLDKDDPDRSVRFRGSLQRGFHSTDHLVCDRCGAESYTAKEGEKCLVCDNGVVKMPVKFSDLPRSEQREIMDDMKGDMINDEERGK